MNEKILDLKVSEKDYEKIVVAILDEISLLNQQKSSEKDISKKDETDFNVYMYKCLLTKLQTCKLYND